jgi:hypothetical protein
MPPFSPPPFAFDPDDKRAYLLMVFTRTPFVPLSVPESAAAWRRNDFPDSTGIYALYLSERPLDDVLGRDRLTTPLSEESIEAVAPTLVYVGKTSRGGRLRDRLRAHYRKIDSRQNISVTRIICRYLVIPHDWNVLFAEENLIWAPEITSTPPPPWNTNGFGSNLPGRGRPGFRAPGATHFDVLFPPRNGALVELEQGTDEG